MYGPQTTELNIDIASVQQFSYEDELRAEEYAPPGNLSPRSAAKYVRNSLKRAAKERKALKKAKKKAKKKDKAGSVRRYEFYLFLLSHLVKSQVANCFFL